MDSSFEAKINTFSSHVLNDAENRLNQLEKEIQEEKTSKIDSKYNEFLADAYEKIQKAISKIQSEDNEQVRLAEFEAKKELLKKRETIINDVFKQAEEKLLEFLDTDEYKAWLKAKLSDALTESGQGEKEIYVIKKDAEILKEQGIDIQVIPVKEKEFLGGVRVKNKDLGILVDYSFYELLEAQRAGFLSKSGLMID